MNNELFQSNLLKDLKNIMKKIMFKFVALKIARMIQYGNLNNHITFVIKGGKF